MNRTPVTSSMVAAVGYDPTSRTLEIEYRGGKVYTYAGVTSDVYDALIAAPSKGRYINEHIKGRFS